MALPGGLSTVGEIMEGYIASNQLASLLPPVDEREELKEVASKAKFSLGDN